jgi:hypothetical protein
MARSAAASDDRNSVRPSAAAGNGARPERTSGAAVSDPSSCNMPVFAQSVTNVTPLSSWISSNLARSGIRVGGIRTSVDGVSKNATPTKLRGLHRPARSLHSKPRAAAATSKPSCHACVSAIGACGATDLRRRARVDGIVACSRERGLRRAACRSSDIRIFKEES